LRRSFVTAVGLSPKHWERIARFQRVLRARDKGSTWTELAALAGYHDASHLVVDFREFVGAAPTRLARGRTELVCS